MVNIKNMGTQFFHEELSDYYTTAYSQIFVISAFISDF